ncbi:carboxypeptidase-like regulatory domain-containing protein [Hymenobacter properus]|uniref:Carboxypeptidase-like regulatory domain-containing protein n=1 Tax=Hymenobacter properus TaxID=2791026 RepID=A0A931BH22_9BACT|nr:carboxypeptidase-like regulatory domain-containing protein [Hymenobacter properus]MBF9141491.1 carboxypeptidase-like regulatory domain-containing protein [Hymenobacter properus]MBR7720300.1 carboxypeptidase-like regulatory domain-containing protein [Microvirga sp. SRT04]
MTTSPALRIPQPCPESWAAMTPTAQGRHCAVCATEVVDFTRMSEAEVLAFLAARSGQRVCGLAFSTQLAPVPASRWRRWLVAGLALLGWQPVASSCAPKPPQSPPAQASASPASDATAPETQQIVIRGQVLDGANNTPVAGIRVLINDTEFGTTTDDKGNFELTMARSWAPIANGKVALKFSGNPFDFKEQTVAVDVRTTPRPAPLMVQLASIPDRGKVMGRIRMPEPPVAPPVK